MSMKRRDFLKSVGIGAAGVAAGAAVVRSGLDAAPVAGSATVSASGVDAIPAYFSGQEVKREWRAAPYNTYATGHMRDIKQFDGRPFWRTDGTT